MGLFDSIKKLTEDTVDIVTAPVRVAVDTARIVTKPIADVAREAADEVEDAADGEESDG